MSAAAGAAWNQPRRPVVAAVGLAGKQSGRQRGPASANWPGSGGGGGCILGLVSAAQPGSEAQWVSPL